MGRNHKTLAIWSFLLLLPGCQKKQNSPPDRPVSPENSVLTDAQEESVVPRLGFVEVKRVVSAGDTSDSVVISDKELTRSARGILQNAGLFVAATKQGDDDDADAPSLDVRIGYVTERVEVETKGAARARVRVVIADSPGTRIASPEGWKEHVEAAGEAPYDKPGGTVSQSRINQLFFDLVSSMVSDLLESYITRRNLHRGSDREVITALSEETPEIVEEAITIARKRSIRSANETLLKLLEHPEETVRDAALGALVQFKERKAVAVLGRSRSMRNTREMRKILAAIAEIGGEDAASYLSFVSEAHDDPEIRELAEQALSRSGR